MPDERDDRNAGASSPTPATLFSGRRQRYVAKRFGDVLKAVLGQRTKELNADAVHRSGCEITSQRLMQRADKSHRYGKHPEYREAVAKALA